MFLVVLSCVNYGAQWDLSEATEKCLPVVLLILPHYVDKFLTILMTAIEQNFLWCCFIVLW